MQPAAGRGGDPAGQDHHDGVRGRLPRPRPPRWDDGGTVTPRPPLPAAPQPLEPGPLGRRFVVGHRQRRGRRAVPDGPRHRHRRLDPHPGRLLRRLGPQADLRAGAQVGLRAARVQLRPHRPAGPQRRRLRRGARRDRRPRPLRPHQPASAGRTGALPRRARAGHRRTADRRGPLRHRRTGPGATPRWRPASTRRSAALERAGARLVEVDLPYWDELHDATFLGLQAEAFAWHRPMLQQRWDDYGGPTRAQPRPRRADLGRRLRAGAAGPPGGPARWWGSCSGRST